jgi:glutathione S-transferase
MTTIHHLGRSQSERILWLCEELEIPYQLVKYARDPVTRLSPPELKAMHPLGAAPLLEADGVLLAESGAIVAYLLARHGGGRLQHGPEHPGFADYLYWFHFANGNLQPTIFRSMLVARCGLATDHPVRVGVEARQHQALALVDGRLAENAHLAGREFTAADVMTVFSLTTMRLFHPYDLAPYPSILRYLQRIGERPAYRRAMAKGDPDLEPVLGPRP